MRLVVGLLSVVALALAVPAAADPPTIIQFDDLAFDTNPCTGEFIVVSFQVTAYVHVHDSRFVVREERTIRTSDEFVGRGTLSLVSNGQVRIFEFTDIVANASGDRIRARTLSVLDFSTMTERVLKAELTCLGP